MSLDNIKNILKLDKDCSIQTVLISIFSSTGYLDTNKDLSEFNKAFIKVDKKYKLLEQLLSVESDRCIDICNNGIDFIKRYKPKLNLSVFTNYNFIKILGVAKYILLNVKNSASHTCIGEGLAKYAHFVPGNITKIVKTLNYLDVNPKVISEVNLDEEIEKASPEFQNNSNIYYYIESNFIRGLAFSNSCLDQLRILGKDKDLLPNWYSDLFAFGTNSEKSKNYKSRVFNHFKHYPIKEFPSEKTKIEKIQKMQYPEFKELYDKSLFPKEYLDRFNYDYILPYLDNTYNGRTMIEHSPELFKFDFPLDCVSFLTSDQNLHNLMKYCTQPYTLLRDFFTDANLFEYLQSVAFFRVAGSIIFEDPISKDELEFIKGKKFSIHSDLSKYTSLYFGVMLKNYYLDESVKSKRNFCLNLLKGLKVYGYNDNLILKILMSSIFTKVEK